MNLQNIILIIVIILFVGTGFIWYQYFRALPETASEVIEEAGVSIRIAELRGLKNLRLDKNTSVLRDPFFRALEIPAIAEAPDSAERNPNPFLPR